MQRITIFAAFLFLSNIVLASKIDTLVIHSLSMQKDINCIVIVPDDYTIMGDAYPVLYLLHGWSGNFAGWLTDAPQLRQHADQYKMLIVCPDGGYDSWYLDSPVDTSVRYETHICQEVLPFIDYYYHVKRDRAGRAIGGLSMGGHGAMYLAARHPDLFGAVGSISGGLDLRPWKKNDWDLKGVLGDPKLHWQNWEKNSVVNWVDALKKGKFNIIMDCGADDFFLPTNQEMHHRLLDAHVPHEYMERPGEHNAEYWGNSIDYQVLFFHKYFQTPKQ